MAGEQFVKGKQERKPDQFGNLDESERRHKGSRQTCQKIRQTLTQLAQNWFNYDAVAKRLKRELKLEANIWWCQMRLQYLQMNFGEFV